MESFNIENRVAEATVAAGRGLSADFAMTSRKDALLAWNGGQYIKPQEAKLDPAGEVKPEKPTVLQGGVEKVETQEERERRINWDGWHDSISSKFISTFGRLKAQAELNGAKFEQGLKAEFNFDVQKVVRPDGSIAYKATNATVESSGNSAYDQLVANTIRELNRQGFPEFPAGTQKQAKHYNENISLSDHTGYDQSYGDEEIAN